MITCITEYVQNLIIIFNNYAVNNQVIAGAISLWGLGVLSYFARNIPSKIWNVIVRQSTTTMVLLSSSPTFYNFQIWFYKQGYSDQARAIKISSGKWGDDKAVKSMGYGNHYFFYNYMPFKLNMVKIDNTNNSMERDELTITVLGRSHRFFNKLFKEVKDCVIQEEKVQVYQYDPKSYWKPVISQVKRNIDTVFLDELSKSKVLNHIDDFIAKENWHVNNGLSYQTGILLYGFPGCGKTSLIKAIASYYDKPIYILSASMLYCIDSAILDLPENSLLLIEDIDTDIVLHKRDYPENKNNEGLPVTDPMHSAPVLQLSLTNLSDVLNSLDGIVAVHGRLLIATTNHVEKLDPALLRNGRFDLKVKIGYANNFVLNNFFKRYYPDFKIDPDFQIADNIPASKIQSLILNNLDNPMNVLDSLNK